MATDQDYEISQRVARRRPGGGQTQRALPLPFAARVLITDKVLAVLVDGVVCEMHAYVVLEVEEEKRRGGRINIFM